MPNLQVNLYFHIFIYSKEIKLLKNSWINSLISLLDTKNLCEDKHKVAFYFDLIHFATLFYFATQINHIYL